MDLLEEPLQTRHRAYLRLVSGRFERLGLPLERCTGATRLSTSLAGGGRRSDADVEAAFAQAFGVELADWMVSWARVQVERVERPLPEPSSALLGLLVAAVFVGGATFLVRGRQVS